MKAHAWRWRDRGFAEDASLFAPPIYPWTLKGKGVFETMRVDVGRVPLWPFHRRRLLSSLTKIGVSPPSSFSGPSMSRSVMAAADLATAPARMRLMVWAYRGKTEAVMQLFPEPLNHWPDREGVRVDLVEVRQLTPFRKPRVKSIDYAVFQNAWEQVSRDGYGEAILINRHRVVIEASRANVFLVKGGEVVTPALEQGALSGVARRVVIDVARRNGIQVLQKRVRADELHQAEEIFLTNAVKGIVPVVGMCDRPVGNGREGLITAQLQRAFEERLARGPALAAC